MPTQQKSGGPGNRQPGGGHRRTSDPFLEMQFKAIKKNIRQEMAIYIDLIAGDLKNIDNYRGVGGPAPQRITERLQIGATGENNECHGGARILQEQQKCFLHFACSGQVHLADSEETGSQ